MGDEFLDYELPPRLIAQQPCAERDQARLLVVRRAAEASVAQPCYLQPLPHHSPLTTHQLEHRTFVDLPDLLSPGDLLVLNDTRVLPARLLGRRQRTGGRWEGLFLRQWPDASWELLSQTRGRLSEGEIIQVEPGPLRLTLLRKTPEGHWLVQPSEAPLSPVRGGAPGAPGSGVRGRSPEPSCSLTPSPQPRHPRCSPGVPGERGFSNSLSTMQVLERHGQVPLPPYIRKGRGGAEDRERYQTLYARSPGAVAAPTAGLHFTPRLFERLKERGIGWAFVTLHVGLGTFQPIQGDDIRKHRMHQEWGELPEAAAAALRECKARGGRVVAVGTTTVRVLETVAASGPLRAWSGETDLFIHPPYTFRAVDALVTNFHLPRSTLLLLVAAFAGIDLIRHAYMTAIEREYRFYSYGDAMLIL